MGVGWGVTVALAWPGLGNRGHRWVGDEAWIGQKMDQMMTLYSRSDRPLGSVRNSMWVASRSSCLGVRLANWGAVMFFTFTLTRYVVFGEIPEDHVNVSTSSK